MSADAKRADARRKFAGDRKARRRWRCGNHAAWSERQLLRQNLEDEISFAQLLQEVEKIDKIKRIRFMTSHPKDLSDELIEVMKNSDKDLQTSAPSAAVRLYEDFKGDEPRYTKEQYLELAAKIRREIPDISLTTDIMVGFPGETAEDVEDTIDVIRKVGFDNAFTFIYLSGPEPPQRRWSRFRKKRFTRL